MSPKPLKDIEKWVRALQPTHARSWSPSSRKSTLHSSTREERKRTTELEGRLAFLELVVESCSTRGSDTTVRLEEHVCTLEQELSDVAAEADHVRTEAEVEAGVWGAEL
jgi:hypothetical protein